MAWERGDSTTWLCITSHCNEDGICMYRIMLKCFLESGCQCNSRVNPPSHVPWAKIDNTCKLLSLYKYSCLPSSKYLSTLNFTPRPSLDPLDLVVSEVFISNFSTCGLMREWCVSLTFTWRKRPTVICNSQLGFQVQRSFSKGCSIGHTYAHVLISSMDLVQATQYD